jgi:exosortase C (VPDSG-CTERM-specific)
LNETLPSNPPPAGTVPLKPLSKDGSAAYRRFAFLTAILLLAFSVPLFNLLRYSLGERSLYSHVILIPFVSAYFVWLERKRLPLPFPGAMRSSLPFILIGIGLLLAGFFLGSGGHQLSTNDILFFTIGSFVMLFLGAARYALGSAFFRQIAFPLWFLIFMVPFPEAVTSALENASKHASAETYAFFMNLAGLPYFRQGLVFALPGLNIEVAQECSGIRSSLVLFITSLIAGYIFLSRPRNRALLAFVVIPLGVVRNAFRILVLSYLTVHWDPRVIDSPLHHRGGPLFFALSLVPFLLLLGLLVRSEKRRTKNQSRPVC